MNIDFDSADRTEIVAVSLRRDGWCALANFFSPRAIAVLHDDCLQRRATFAPAAIGRGDARHQRDDQRRDSTLWLSTDAPQQQDFLLAMAQLQRELNRHLYLGLHDYEAHYAHYAAGAFYRRHLDAFARTAGAPCRILSSIIYLNDCDGGELVLWQHKRELARIAPRAGTAVFFLSAEFPHEVLPSHGDRYSIAGWFRGR